MKKISIVIQNRLTETQEQSIHSHWIDTEEHRGNQICSNHDDDNRHQIVVQSVRVYLTFQIEMRCRAHTKSDQKFR